MKQKQVIDKLIADTESGEMVWVDYESTYGTHKYYKSGEFRFNKGISQSLHYYYKPIAEGIWLLRGLGVAINKQLMYAEEDKMSEIYNKILTG